MGALDYKANLASMPVGSTVNVPYNLTDPNWLPCLGQKVSRSLYPALSACLPSVGTFTATSRTKTGTPTSSAIAADATNWVVTSAVGTSNLYTTPDGITYTARTTPVSCDVRSILNDGTNFVAANAVAGAMQYSTNSGATWNTSATATVAATAGTLQTCMTWASSLGTVGRFCVALGVGFYTSDDRGVTWTRRTTGVSGNQFHVCWTGTKFIATGANANTIYTSADGITWAAQTMPFATAVASSQQGSIISDGNGRVLWMDGDGAVISVDHGVNWSRRLFNPTGTAVANHNLFSCANYTNGRFIFTPSDVNAVTLMSTDLVAWAFTNVPVGTTSFSTFSYKAGIYLMNRDSATTGAYTLVEDASYMTLPSAQSNSYAAGVSVWNNFMPWIKVR